MNLWVAIPTFLATLAWISVVAWFWIRAKWWKTDVGRNAMGLSFFIAISLMRLSYAHLNHRATTHSSFWLTAFGIFIYTGLTFFGAQRVYFIEQSQRQKTGGLKDR
jgi:hypothetical protein